MTSQEKVRERSALICQEFYRFVASGGYTDVRINPIAVKTAVKSWADDAERHSAYHNSILSPCKHAALLLYWLVKIKPVFLSLDAASYAESKYSESRYKTVNECFAFSLALNILGVVPKTAIREKFIYLLFFRDVNPKHLFLTLEMLCNSMPEYLKLRFSVGDKLTAGMG